MKISTAATGAGLLALALASCAPPHPAPHPPLKTIARLTCPRAQGDLTLKSAAADGQSCAYSPEEGGEVSLQLLALNGKDSSAALAPLEASLAAEIPPSAHTGASVDAEGGNVKIEANGDGESHGKGKVDIDLPGIHIHANDDGASLAHADAAAKSGVRIDAGDNGARIHITEPGDGVRLSYILASDKPGPNGYKAVGYEARGPSAGPLVVAVIKSTSDDHDTLRHDIRALLKLNVGG